MTETPMQSSAVSDAGKGALLVLFLVTMIDMIGFGIVIPFLTYLVEDLTPENQIANIGLWVGLLMTSYSAAQFLFSPFWGSLSDRIGRRPVLMVGLIGNTLFFTMFGLANTLIVALSARFLAGVFNGNLAVARAYIGDVSTPQQLATRMGLIGAAFGLGFTFGPFIGGELSDPAARWALFENTVFESHPYLLPCAVASLLSLFSLAVAYRSLPESLPPESRVKSEPLPWAARMSQMMKNSASMLKSQNISLIIWVSMLFTFGFTIMHAVFILYTEMDPVNGGLAFSEADNGRIFAMIGITGILTQGLLIGPLSRRFGSRRLIPVASAITGLGLVLVPYTQAANAWSHILLVAVLIALGNGIFQPSSSSFLTRIAKANGYELGVVMGAQESLGAFARILGPLTGGLVWTMTASGDWPFDYHTAFHLCGIMMLLASILAFRLPALDDEESIQNRAEE
ncbi:MAG: MFS transporter [Euryarchaeota archaeon]|nr:MFS transporter [Euryarchaeota archaeon]MBT6640764.1 MFS transporter [Euryarchaeota archaeon]MBT6845586.1 MFS transporter [Euryarchaeota archaeon]MBT7063299.1 MFS transporter [Euryarchaeota archaeon]MBT7262697.1 MFS transporter [Euryarchaeota archaeon]